MRIIAVVAMLVAMPAVAAVPPPPDYGAPIAYNDGVKIGEDFIKNDLLDPYSVKFTWPYTFVPYNEKVWPFKRTTGYATCLTYNAKNSYGGYIGIRKYRIIVRDSKVIDLMAVSDLKMVPDMCQELIDKYGMISVPTAPHSEPPSSEH